MPDINNILRNGEYIEYPQIKQLAEGVDDTIDPQKFWHHPEPTIKLKIKEVLFKMHLLFSPKFKKKHEEVAKKVIFAFEHKITDLHNKYEKCSKEYEKLKELAALDIEELFKERNLLVEKKRKFAESSGENSPSFEAFSEEINRIDEKIRAIPEKEILEKRLKDKEGEINAVLEDFQNFTGEKLADPKEVIGALSTSFEKGREKMSKQAAVGANAVGANNVLIEEPVKVEKTYQNQFLDSLSENPVLQTVFSTVLKKISEKYKGVIKDFNIDDKGKFILTLTHPVKIDVKTQAKQVCSRSKDPNDKWVTMILGNSQGIFSGRLNLEEHSIEELEGFFSEARVSIGPIKKNIRVNFNKVEKEGESALKISGKAAGVPASLASVEDTSDLMDFISVWEGAKVL